MNAAPFYAEVAEGPSGAVAQWLNASDGVRLRVASWAGPDNGGRGTVLLFPGRTEYIEKYGRAAGVLRAAGYGTVTIDWRGQGLADRALKDRATGHVLEFADYQLDVEALCAFATAQGLPRPWHLLAHSMGGCIGLRALLNGLPVNAACFTSPMWGIAISRPLRPVAWSLSWAARQLGFGHAYAPGTRPVTYVREAAFAGNLLTKDAEMYHYMLRQVTEHEDLALGGPSMHWLHEALRETVALAGEASPPVPALTFLGTDERIVDSVPIHDRMSRWPGGRLEMVEAAEHEVMMEVPQTRTRVFDAATSHFAAHS